MKTESANWPRRWFPLRSPDSRMQRFFRTSPFSRLSAALLAFWLAASGHGLAAPKTPPAPHPAPVPSGPRYFYTIDLDPQYQIVGTGAMTQTQAAKSNAYRFTYGPNGKVTEIAYFRAGTPMPDPFFGVASIAFERQPGIERRWFHDTQGKLTKNIDDVAGEELSLNAAGFPTEVANLDEDGGRARDSNGVTHYVRVLDDHNRLIKGRRIGFFGNAVTDNNGFFETRTVYDEQGRPVERGNYDASGKLLNNNDGVALVRTSYTIYPDSIQSIESYFDASGLPVNDKGSGAHEVERTLDKRGLLLSESYYDLTGAPTLDVQGSVHERRYAYDDRGNEISEEFFDANGKPTDQDAAGFAKVVYKYDDKNRVIEKAYFGDDGGPLVLLNLNAAIIRQEYDAKGNMIRRQFFDGKGNPSPHKIYLAPSIRIVVQGDTTTIYLRDANDKPMQNPIAGYASFSYKTDTDQPLSPHNTYYSVHGRKLSYFPRIAVINPHLYALKTAPVMQWSARGGATAVGIGALLGCILALRKSSHTRRRKVYVPTAIERLLGWLAVFAIFEGTLRFFMTVYWAWVGYQNGLMSHKIYVLEGIFIAFFLYRLIRTNFTMRVLNIGRDDIHRLIRDFFAKAEINPEWLEARKLYTTSALDVRVRFFKQKYHAYLAFRRRHREGRDLARGLAQYIRAHVGAIQAPSRSRAIALYYPSVALCYFLLSGTAFYTLWQLVK